MKTLIVLTVVVLVGFALWKKWVRTTPQFKEFFGVLFGIPAVYRQTKQQFEPSPSSYDAYNSYSQQKMMPCARCGLHVLEHEGVKIRGQFYCTKDHAH